MMLESPIPPAPPRPGLWSGRVLPAAGSGRLLPGAGRAHPPAATQHPARRRAQCGRASPAVRHDGGKCVALLEPAHQVRHGAPPAPPQLSPDRFAHLFLC